MNLQKQPSFQQDKLWSKVPNSLRFAKSSAIISDTFDKNNGKKRYLAAFEDFLLLYKLKDDAHPKGMLRLSYEVKCELKRVIIQRKKDEDPKIGEIQHLELSHEQIKKPYQLFSSNEQLKKWRDFLIKRVNHLEFHHLFRVYKKIGKGNFASVYQSERLEDNKDMAVKAFSKNIAFNEENGKEALMNEITIMRQLDHINLLKLYEVYETQNSIYMCMELLEGGSLYDLLKNHIELSQKDIKTIMIGILEGLKYLHSKDIMHRDLKLENILFRKPNQYDTLVIADFGLSTNVNAYPYLYTRCGTPGYVAPEVINIKDMNTSYSSICDIYSVGLILHLLITGKAAFSGKSYTTVVKQNREALIDFTQKLFEKISSRALDFMKKTLERDPKKRINAIQALTHPFLFEKCITENEQFKLNLNYNPDDITETLDEQPNKFFKYGRSSIISRKSNSPQIIPSRQLKHDNQDENFHMRSPLLFEKPTESSSQNSGCNSPTLNTLQTNTPIRNKHMPQQPSKFKSFQLTSCNQPIGNPKSSHLWRVQELKQSQTPTNHNGLTVRLYKSESTGRQS